jgi:hypothetical protein
MSTTKAWIDGKTLSEAIEAYSNEVNWIEFETFYKHFSKGFPSSRNIASGVWYDETNPPPVDPAWQAKYQRMLRLLRDLQYEIFLRLQTGSLSAVGKVDGAPRGAPPEWIEPVDWSFDQIDWDYSILRTAKRVFSEIRVIDVLFKDATSYLRDSEARSPGRPSRRETDILPAIRYLKAQIPGFPRSLKNMAAVIRAVRDVAVARNPSGSSKGLGDDAIREAIKTELAADLAALAGTGKPFGKTPGKQ